MLYVPGSINRACAAALGPIYPFAAGWRIDFMRNLVRTTLIVGVVVIVCASLVSPTLAWDHKRKGFIFGGTLGAMGLWDPTDSESFGWAAGAIKIGYAPSDQLMIYYTSRNLVTPTFMGSLTFAADYYMKPDAPAFFFTGGGGAFGGFLWAAGYGGYSVYSGVGYEFARHWQVALEAGYTWFEIVGEDSRRQYNGLDVRLLVSLTGY
jgi:hypothetical protein